MDLAYAKPLASISDLLATGKYQPITSANVTSVVRWNTADIDDNAENHEANARDDLDDAEGKFDLVHELSASLCKEP